MVTRILRWIPGWLRVETEGGYSERLLNELTAAGIEVWHLRRYDEHMQFSCRAGDYRRMRPMARRACMRMRIQHKHGFPFWRHRYRHRKGLLVGLVVYVVILILLSPRIWVVQVEGNTETSTDEILEQAQQYGVCLGSRMDGVDVKGFQLYGPDEMPTVSYVTINPSHCVARIQVTEREPTPEIIDLSRPSNVVASRDGRILQMEVRSGQPLVRVGEAVTAGTVLISGRMNTELGEQRYRAYGEVWAETTRRITVSVPLLQMERVPTDRVICRPVFSLLCWEFPLYSKMPLQAETAHFNTVHAPTIKGITLPISLTCDYLVYLEQQRLLLTAEQAENMAQMRLVEEERELFLPERYVRLSEFGRIQGNAYVLSATYRCQENIALEVPLA